MPSVQKITPSAEKDSLGYVRFLVDIRSDLMANIDALIEQEFHKETEKKSAAVEAIHKNSPTSEQLLKKINAGKLEIEDANEVLSQKQQALDALEKVKITKRTKRSIVEAALDMYFNSLA